MIKTLEKLLSYLVSGRLLAQVAAGFSLFTFSFLPNSFAASYPDVPEDHPSYQEIEELDQREIIQGYPNGIFKPEDPVNRAEALKIITKSLDLAQGNNYSQSFPDVKTDDWFFSWVMAAKEAGIINGYADGSFKPGNTVNLAEFSKILVLSLEGEDFVSSEEMPNQIFTDVSKNEWFGGYMFYLREKNILLAGDNGGVDPGKLLTRAEVATYIYRAIQVHENDGKAYDLTTTWPYYKSQSLPFQIKYDPQNWQVKEGGHEVTFFRPDKDFKQFSETRIYPNSGVLEVTMDLNLDELSATEYFENIKRVFPFADYTEFEFNGFKAFEVVRPNDRIVDWYVYLGDADGIANPEISDQKNQVLVVYTQYGDGVLALQIKKILGQMLKSLEYRTLDPEAGSKSELLSEIFANVLVQDVGMTMLEKIGDKIIIETDTIGVGTGPVDYYYSENLGYTFKYERENDVILGSREGRTSAF